MTDMNQRFFTRALPGVVVIALLALAAAAPQRRPGIAVPPQLQRPCDEFASAVAGDSTVDVPSGSGLEQALPAEMSVAACSLRTLARVGTFLQIELRDWDPTTLAPDPDAIALRRAFFNGSNLIFRGGQFQLVSFVPPVVLTSIPGVAEPPKPQVAMQLLRSSEKTPPNLLTGYFTPEGPAELPAAVKLNEDGSREPLPGPHPVLAHAVCAGDTDLAALRVVQGVSRTDVKPFPAPKEFLQRFRVPEQVELRWIELALAETFDPYFQQAGDESRVFPVHGIPTLAVIDGEAMPDPLPDVPPSMVEARLLAAVSPAWISHLDFDRTVTLEPEHDYWIWVRETAAFTFFNRRVRGDEPPEFGLGVGPYYCRVDSAGEWNRTADQVLAFRILARPVASPPPAPEPPPPASAFALSATPNPAPGPVRVDWSGAVGPVRFEVLDARGRRVSQGIGGAAGTWTWPGTDRDGRAVASGIYFVRARDSAGQLSNHRVMIVR